MDLNQLSVFVRVIDAQSFTKAARYLKQPKSRVSRRIAMLEQELGVALLYRTTRRFHPTETGLALYRAVREHIYALEAASQVAHEQSQKISGVLKISAAEDMGTALLGPVVDEVTRLHPELSVNLQLSNHFVDLVRDGFDLAIRFGALEDTTLVARQLGRIGSILVASPEYLEKAPRIESLEDLSKHPTLDFAFDEDEVGVWRFGTKRVKINPVCRSSHPQVLVQLALAGRGVALVPEFLCSDAIRSGRLQHVLPSQAIDSVPVSFVWPAQKELNLKVKAFVEIGLRHLTKYFSN